VKSYDDDDRDQREGYAPAFELAGSKFTAKPNFHARDLAALNDFEADLAQTQVTPRGSFETLNDIIRNCLLPESRERWDALLAADLPNPITLSELMRVAYGLLEQVTGRPTQPLSPSGDTDESTNTPSTERSGSQEEPAPKPSISAVS